MTNLDLFCWGSHETSKDDLNKKSLKFLTLNFFLGYLKNVERLTGLGMI